MDAFVGEAPGWELGDLVLLQSWAKVVSVMFSLPLVIPKGLSSCLVLRTQVTAAVVRALHVCGRC